MKLLHTAHVPAGDGPFPTLILCHGWGASAHDLLGLAPHIHDGEALMLCPQGQMRMQVGPGASGYGWFQLVPGLAPNEAEFRERAAELRAWLDEAVERYPVDKKRLAVGGFSQGGLMAFELGLREPGRFRGIAALSTWLPELLAVDLPKLPEHESLPVLVFHGTEDRMIEVERARESRERLREFGVRLLYREFPMAHEIRPEALSMLERWLGEKVFAESLIGDLGTFSVTALPGCFQRVPVVAADDPPVPTNSCHSARSSRNPSPNEIPVPSNR